jgi:4-amino-4-deoxy-L-arabinose transferase-like glycosyltransferase
VSPEPVDREPAAPPTSLEPAFIALFGLALLLRLAGLYRRELWVDEGATWHFARMLGEGRLAEQLALEPTPPLYYGLVGLLLRLCGDADLILRLPSWIFGALTPPLVLLLGERLGWRRAGLAGGLLLACHPLHIFLSQEARVYPLVALLVVALAIALQRALERGDGKSWAWVCFWLTLTFYSHLFGLFAGAAVAVLALALSRDRAGRTRGLAAVAIALLLFSPWLMAAGPGLRSSGATWTQELFARAAPGEQGLPRVVEGQLVGARYHLLQRQLAVPETPPVLRWPAILAQALLLAAAASLAFRPGPDRRHTILAAGLYLLPFLLPWAIGKAGGLYFFQPGRHDFLVLGPLCLLLGAGFEALRRRWRILAWLLIPPIVAGSLFRLHWLQTAPAGRAATERGRYLAEVARPGDLAIAFGIERLLAERYARLAGTDLDGALRFESFPAETDRHPGYSDPRPLLRRLWDLKVEARERVARQAGRGRILTIERSLPGDPGRLPGWEVDELYLQTLRETGWREESFRQKLLVRVWSPP